VLGEDEAQGNILLSISSSPFGRIRPILIHPPIMEPDDNNIEEGGGKQANVVIN